MNALDPRRAPGAAPQSVPSDEVEYEIGRRRAEAPDPLATFASEPRFELARIVLEAWNDLTTVAPRRAPAGRFRIDDDRVDPRFGEMQRRRKPEIARADDQHARVMRAFERRHRGWSDRRLLPHVRVSH